MWKLFTLRKFMDQICQILLTTVTVFFLNNVTPIKCLSAIGLKFFYRKKLTYISRLYIWISLALMQKHKLLSSKPSEPTFRNYIIPILAKLLEV